MNDLSIKRAALNALEWDPSLDAADLGVTVEDGIVTLSGYVPSYFQKLIAERAVKRLKAVRGVVDRIEVRLMAAPHADEAIARRAADLIDWDIAVPPGAVKVGVNEGFVTLTGEVRWQYQRLAAERGIRQLAGVRGLYNQIALKPAVQTSDVKKRIEEALAQQADVEADKIRISVDGDTVRLDGRVRAWFERDVAEKAAWSAPGVRQVEDHVSVGT